MKKIVFGLALATFLASSALLATPAFNKAHKGAKGLEGAKVNCVYCHKTAKIEKKKGQDLAKLKKTKYCAMKDCH
jgi:hypothetical protein